VSVWSCPMLQRLFLFPSSGVDAMTSTPERYGEERDGGTKV
jgi:hypothetical protein